MPLISKFWSATWGVAVSIGILAWAIGKFAIGWVGLLRFLGASLIIVLVMSVWCGHRARQAVLQIGMAAGVQRWDPCCFSVATIFREMFAVIGAILLELLLPVVLILAFMSLVEAVVNLLKIQSAWDAVTSDILATMSNVWTESPADIHLEIVRALAPFNSVTDQIFQKGIGVIKGTISISVSLALLLVRRRNAYLNSTQVISEEIDLIVKDAFQSVPAILGNQMSLVSRPRGQLLIGASSDRQFLLLDPGTGLAAKLPACLLRSAVAFFQADLSLNQVYNGLLSQAFAKADAARRKTYLTYLDNEWTSRYQPTAFATLFRLGFYLRLRFWSF